MRSANMYKPRVIFPFTEAGMGHIMPLTSVADAFEQKYAAVTEVVRTNFYTDSNNEDLIKFEKMLCSQVTKHNRMPGYGEASFVVMKMFRSIATPFVMRWTSPSPHSFTESVKRMNELAPDLVFSTHWATSYVAANADPRPINLQYCPDMRLDYIWRTGADLTLMPGQKTMEKAQNEPFFKDMRFERIPILLRNNVYAVDKDKDYYREKLGIEKDRFVVTLADGGYGAGLLEPVVKKLVKSNLHITIQAVCGKNTELYESFIDPKFLAKVSSKVDFRPLPFVANMPELLAASDLFCGKSGASAMAEPAYLGIPQLITKYATPIEKSNGEYYIDEVGCAVKEFKPKKAVALIEKFASDPNLLIPYRQNALDNSESGGAEKAADIIYRELQARFPDLVDAEG